MEGTDSIRAQAPKWTLAGDHNLLKLLQNTHQKIVSKCQEVNAKLAEMASTLDDASINLQNVNNKFMALSNSQFIESRVYDDDADVMTETNPAEEPPKSEPLDEIAVFKRSLSILDSAHETAEILDDSDSDDSDAEISVVLKPKDAYAHRPLPFIIGSQAWKNKWHAGLMVEDSDSDSSGSRRHGADDDQYSESEEDVRTDKHIPDTAISESSSSLHSEREKESSVPDKRTPADIAAELAARLRRSAPVVEVSEEYSPAPPPAARTVYRPQEPVSSTIFSDEPPPLDAQNEQNSSESQEENDIFAEINKKQPYNNNYTTRDGAADLFGATDDDFNDFNKNKVETKDSKQKATLFDDESEPELFVEKPLPKASPKENSHSSKKVEVEDSTTKKPVGGISLFGSNKGTESIGAAILKRNRRKSSSSEHESDDNTRNSVENEPAATSEDRDITASNANAIFDNLFAKAKQAEQKLIKPAKIDRAVKQEKPEPKEVKDLFSDNIFDDIDDIFTSTIKMPTSDAKKNVKSIFDDDDDLFSDIAKKPKDTKATSSNFPKKSIFDSDDDLFSEVKAPKESSTKIYNNEKTEKVAATESEPNIPVIKQKSTISKENNNNKTKDIKPPEIVKQSIFDEASKTEIKPKAKSKSIFDSDSDDDLFSNVQIKPAQPNNDQKSNNSININADTEAKLFKENKETKQSVTGTIKINEKPKVFQSPSLFEEEEIDDLFINANKAKMAQDVISKNTDIKQIVPEYISSLNDHQKKTDENPVLENIVTKVEDHSDINKENQRPVIVDTKPSDLPKIDKANTITDQLFDDNLLEDELFTKPKETDSTESHKSELVLEDEVKVQIRSISIDVTEDSEWQDPNTTDFTTNALITDPKKTTEPQKTNFSDGEAHTNQLDYKENKLIFEVPSLEKQDDTIVHIIPEQTKSVPLAAAFDEIFSEPPAFEKTKETKKTTNVNALFEDDSDDESLFFKKNDVISDEKPEIFSPSADFGIFNDEPPALDVDFIPKVNKNNDFDNDDDLFSSVPKKEVNANLIRNDPLETDAWDDDPKDDTPVTESIRKHSPQRLPDDLDTNIFSSPEIPKTFKPTKAPSKEIPDSDEELFGNTPKVPEISHKENMSTNSESNTKEVGSDQVDKITKFKEIKDITETKKIGKLNTKNLNINVQALVPGASPKKIPKEQSNEEFVNTTKDIVEWSTEVDNAELKSTKSISFESKPEAGILDNNLSKQRARIQVKRRPSTRRARHEAARKSVIDVDDDTDNSSSFDEPKPTTSQDKEEIESNSKNKISSESKIQDMPEVENPYEHKITKYNNSLLKSNEDGGNRKTFNIHDEITKDVQTNKVADEVDSKLNSSNVRVNEPKREDLTQKVPSTENSVAQNEEEKEQKSPEKTTKLVYILNDEDIFKTSKDTGDDTDDLFKTKAIKTIGNTYRDTTKNIEAATTKKDTNVATSKQDTNKSDSKQATKNIETIEIEKESSKNVPPTKKDSKSLFDLSDDDDALFGKSTKTRKVETKSKLFESDSEEDLFSGKKGKVKKVEKVKNVVKVKGSLFGDDDDDEELFGIKSKTQVSESKTSSTSKKATSSKDAAKSTKIVFDDPLSMLDDD